MNDLAVLQVIRVKGRCAPADIARVLDVADSDVATTLAPLAGAGLVTVGATAVRLTPEGLARLRELAERERAELDAAAVDEAYEAFTPVNALLKAVVSAWQIKPDGSVNDHGDKGYDAGVVTQLADVHASAQPVLARIAALRPRLARYGERLQSALEAVQAGDLTYIARPITDSYHTVWFELHEELISLAGRTRADEAAAGRAH